MPDNDPIAAAHAWLDVVEKAADEGRTDLYKVACEAMEAAQAKAPQAIHVVGMYLPGADDIVRDTPEAVRAWVAEAREKIPEQ
jgi:hypothetical protein